MFCHKIVFGLVSIVLIMFGCTSHLKTLSVKPSTADFKEVDRGESFDIELILKNKYGMNIQISDLTIFGSNDFEIKGNVTTPFIMPKGTQRILIITFTPTANGLINALLQIKHTGPINIKTVNLTGIGVPVAKISLSETSYDFQWSVTRNTHTHDFEIENIGTAELEISNIFFSGAGASAYSITSGDAPVYIQPNAKHIFTVTFAPTIVGTFPTDLNINHNAKNGNNPFLIHIDGEGVLTNPLIKLSVGSTWNIGTAPITFPGIRVIKIENIGIDPLTLTSATFTNSIEFTVDSLENSNGNAVNFPNAIAVGDYALLYVKFAPTGKTAYNDTLSIVHDGNNEMSPFDISVSGTGRNAITKAFNYSGSIDNWTIPNDVYTLRIEAWGAQGGGTGWGTPGKGAKMQGDFIVQPGEIIKIAVGGEGQTGGKGGGGGGGSFVVLNNQPLIIAGGGGGSHYNNQGLDGKDGVITHTCTPHQSTGTGYTSGSGGGWTGDGANGDYNAQGGKSWSNGLTGGQQHNHSANHWSNGDGGFGGGGGGCWAPGSAGGYNGGVSATSYGNQTPGGTGGGSINNGKNQSNIPGVQIGNGKIVITY